MLNNYKNRKQEGFTIIEVLIVLAIAGLILLVVFLAVPALQRNSRNTQRKSDVSAISGAVTEYVANNNGKVPTTVVNVTDLAKTGFYEGAGGAAGQINIATGVQAALPNTALGDRIVIVTGSKCGASGATVAGAARSSSIQYNVETSNGFTPSCQEI